MASFRIPQDNRVVSQPNDGKLKGNVYSTFNMDFETNPGKINVSPRLKILHSSNSSDSGYIASLGYPVAMKYAFGKWRFVGGTDTHDGKIYINDGTATGTFSADPATSSPTNGSATHSDLEVFNGILYCSSYNALIAKQTTDGGAWSNTAAIGALGTGYNFLKSAPNVARMYYPASSGNIGYINTAGTVVASGAGTIKIIDQTTCATVTESRIWIGTAANYFGEGSVVEWDMSDAITDLVASQGTPNAIHKIGATAAVAILAVNGIPYVLCSDATLKKFNSGGFAKVAQFPSFFLKALIDFYTLPDAYTIKNFIHPNGMTLVNGKINFNIRAVKKTSSKNNLFPEMPSGIWEFDPDSPQKGIYHKYSFTIDQVGTNDFGQFKIERPGMLVETKQPGGTIFAGAGYYTDNSTSKIGLFNDDLSNAYTKRGVLTLPEVFSGSVQETWQDTNIIHEQFVNTTDKIISKYKYKDKTGMPFIAAITWTSSTTFTSTDSDFQYVSGGEEVFVAFGKGGGTTAHVSTISGTSTYTVTLDEGIGFASGTATVIVDNWTKIAVHNTQNQLYTEVPAPGITQPKIQYRFEIRGQSNSPEINQILINSMKQR